MKNYSLLFFILFSIVCLSEVKRQDVTIPSTNIYYNGMLATKIEFYLKTNSVAVFNKLVYICNNNEKSISFYKYQGEPSQFAGTAPTSVIKCSLSQKEDLYVIDKNNELFVLQKISDVSRIWIKIDKNIKWVSHSIDGSTFVLKEGKIYILDNNVVSQRIFNSYELANANKIAIIDKKFGLYSLVVIDDSGEVYFVENDSTNKSHKKLVPSIKAINFCVDIKSNLFVNSNIGLFMGTAINNYEFNKIAEGGYLDISCGEKLWVISGDEYVYSATLELDQLS